MQRAPADATGWRLLGKLRLQAGDSAGAADALRRATQLDPQSAAAHYDLAQALQGLGQSQAAVRHYEQARKLAPESDYGRQAQAQLGQWGHAADVLPIRQVGYEIKRFERSGLVDRLDRDDADSRHDPDDPLPPWSVRLESGLLYNTNVALSPTNRELDPNPRESFQTFLNPELDYALIDAQGWRLGPRFTGYFTANEGQFDDLNLESYQPGAFVEYAVALGAGLLVPRVDYDYTVDRFGGVHFGGQHALGLSFTHLGAWLDHVLYSIIDHTDFADDGTAPELSSRDGWAYTLGLSQTLHTGALEFGLGIELQRANVDGSDYRYHSVGLNGDVAIWLTDGLRLRLEGGTGYRDYFDAQIEPSRNEFLWHAATELRLQITTHWSASLTASYNRFDSDNELFTADRFVGGMTTAIEF